LSEALTFLHLIAISTLKRLKGEKRKAHREIPEIVLALFHPFSLVLAGEAEARDVI
jgi:hypothetical protein